MNSGWNGMAKAIFHREFHYTSRKVNAGWSVKSGPKAQTFPRELIDAAVAAGVAKEALPRRSRRSSVGTSGE